MRIAYTAHTETCTLYLDEDGICRRVVRLRRSTLIGVGAGTDDAAERCIGAQYVATLDFDTRGGLAPSPLVGKPMVFAYVRDNGRIGLVRTGPLVRFDTRPSEIPDSGVRAMPSPGDTIPIEVASAPDADVPDFDDDETDAGATEIRTRVFRATRPPPVQVGTRPPPMRQGAGTGWTPPTPVERVKIAPPPTSSSPTMRMPEPRSRGMLPARRGREKVG